MGQSHSPRRAVASLSKSARSRVFLAQRVPTAACWSIVMQALQQLGRDRKELINPCEWHPSPASEVFSSSVIEKYRRDRVG